MFHSWSCLSPGGYVLVAVVSYSVDTTQNLQQPIIIILNSNHVYPTKYCCLVLCEVQQKSGLVKIAPPRLQPFFAKCCVGSSSRIELQFPACLICLWSVIPFSCSKTIFSDARLGGTPNLYIDRWFRSSCPRKSPTIPSYSKCKVHQFFHKPNFLCLIKFIGKHINIYNTFKI